MSAKIKSRREASKGVNKSLDTRLQKRTRGRPALVNADWVLARADHYRSIFSGGNLWTRLWPDLKNASSDDGVRELFERTDVPDRHEFAALASLIREVVRDAAFPKRRDAQIGFLADSLAGRGLIKPRPSRDLVGRMRVQRRQTPRIIRFEVYVECSCGYTGQSHNLACQKCGARVIWPFETEI